ncbi:MAG: flagellar export chaperone FliS [Porticoccaceae bacterium]|jgi:flagellar protein FliS
MAPNKKAMNAYRTVGVTSAVDYADAVQLIQMLFNGLMDALADAEGHISRNDIVGKNQSISRATKIIIGLKGSLDFDKGGELARNLDDLYDYATRRLLKANIRNDIEAVQEIKGLLGEINGAWELLPSLLKDQTVAMAS